jgi:hypothetical protein
MDPLVDEHSAVPFHLSLTEPLDESAIADVPEAVGGYDPIEQIWKTPNGTPAVGSLDWNETATWSNSATDWYETLTKSENGNILGFDDSHLDSS